MKTDRLKKLNSMLTQSFSPILSKQIINTSSQFNLQQTQCQYCLDIKRQNYYLKQQVHQQDQIKQQMNVLKRQLEALHQLYDLKCQQLIFMQQECQRLKQVQKNQNKSQLTFYEDGKKIIEKVLKKNKQNYESN